MVREHVFEQVAVELAPFAPAAAFSDKRYHPVPNIPLASVTSWLPDLVYTLTQSALLVDPAGESVPCGHAMHLYMVWAFALVGVNAINPNSAPSPMAFFL
jgi:hypothetical protein